MRFRIAAANIAPGWLHIYVDDRGASGQFVGNGGDVACTILVPGVALDATLSVDSKRLVLVFTSLLGAPLGLPQGVDLVSCLFSGFFENPPVSGDFRIEWAGLDSGPSPALPSHVSATFVASTAPGDCEDRCGDGVVTAPAEGCDDQNESNTDGCTNLCQTARCGDGLVEEGVEECDDRYGSDTDDCTNICRAARCGDGFLYAGVEQCDDANSVDEDDCSNDCAWTGFCGDGIVQKWIDEECDDGNTVSDDGCASRCRTEVGCGDANIDARLSASDALLVLKSAVGLADYCPLWLCDTNGNGSLSAADALTVLKRSVGLSVTLKCPDFLPILILSLRSQPGELKALHLEVDYSQLHGDITDDGSSLLCSGSIVGATYTFKIGPERVMTVDVESAAQFDADRELARCNLVADNTVRSRDFQVKVVSATRPPAQPVLGLVAKGVVR